MVYLNLYNNDLNGQFHGHPSFGDAPSVGQVAMSMGEKLMWL